MPKKLKSYASRMRQKAPKVKLEDSGVGCSERKCSGEMMIHSPYVHHQELVGLKRASCAKCGWLGWV